MTASPAQNPPVAPQLAASRTPTSRALRIALSPQGEEILRAVAPVILGSLLPAQPAARAAALEAGMEALDEYLAHFSLPLQRQVRMAFGALASLPARVLLLGTTSHWRSAPPARIDAFLRRARDSRVPMLRVFFALVHSMTVLAWFDQPQAWSELGYPGPPIERSSTPEASA